MIQDQTMLLMTEKGIQDMVGMRIGQERNLEVMSAQTETESASKILESASKMLESASSKMQNVQNKRRRLIPLRANRLVVKNLHQRVKAQWMRLRRERHQIKGIDATPKGKRVGIVYEMHGITSLTKKTNGEIDRELAQIVVLMDIRNIMTPAGIIIVTTPSQSMSTMIIDKGGVMGGMEEGIETISTIEGVM